MPGHVKARRHEDSLLLELVGDICGLLDIEELRHGLLEALHRLLPSDYISLNDVGADPESIVAIISPPTAPEFFTRWAARAHENPLLRNYLKTGDGRAYRFSDVIEQAALHELPLYQELYEPLGIEHQLAFTLPADPDRVVAIACNRGARDYSEQERDLANRARPFLIQAYLNALAYAGRGSLGEVERAAGIVNVLLAAGLTAREAQVLQLLASGRSNHHIAGELGISDRTVGKHLEHSFRKLGVSDRSTAAGRVWELAGGSSSTNGTRAVRKAPARVLAVSERRVGARAL